MDIYPLHVRVNGADIWLAWVEIPDAPPFVWHSDRRVFWARRLPELQKLLSNAGLRSEDSTSLSDIDHVLQEIRNGRLDNPQDALNIWNFFTDFSYTLAEADPGPYEADEGELYDKLFSLSSVAEFMGIQPQNLDADELSRLAVIFEHGGQLVVDNTVQRDN